MLIPLEWTKEAVDRLCAETEDHRGPLAGVTAICLAVAAVTPPGGFLSATATGSASAAMFGAGLGYISNWRGWVE